MPVFHQGPLTGKDVMRAARMQQTLKSACRVSGRGYWSGEVNTLTFLPLPENSGIRFVRSDLPSRPVIPAVAEARQAMPLRTRLATGGAEVDMVEHVLAALYALQIDNVEIQCTSGEMPGLDGSSMAYVLALQTVGLQPQSAVRQQISVAQPIEITGASGQFIRAEPATEPGLTLEYQLDYGPASPIGRSTFRTRITADIFAREIAAARTFVTRAEANTLQNRGLARHVSERDLLVFEDHGPVDNSLRFADECARHKTLDLIGDLALCGVDLHAKVIARCTGHQMNGRMADALRQLVRDTKPNYQRQEAA